MTDFSEIGEFPTVPKTFRTEYKFCFNVTENQVYGTSCMPNGDFILPPTPSSLITDDEFCPNSSKIPSVIHNRGNLTNVYSNAFVPKSTFLRRAETSDYVKELDDEKNVQTMLDISQNIPGELFDSINLSENNSFGVIMDNYVDDPKEILKVNNINSLSKARFPRIIIVRPNKRYITLPINIPLHRKSVHFQKNEMKTKMSQAVQTRGVREHERTKRFALLDNADFVDDGDNTDGLEVNIFDKLSEDTASLHENVSNHLLSTCTKTQAQDDNKVDIAVSPVAFLTDEKDKYGKDEQSIVDTTSYAIHVKTLLKKTSPQTDSGKVRSHTRGSTFELIVTEPSPIIECSVIENDNPVHPFQKNTYTDVYEHPDFNSNQWKQPAIFDESKSIFYASVKDNEAEDSQRINHVVVVDDTTSTNHCLPTQDPFMYLGFENVGYQGRQWFNNGTRNFHSPVTFAHDPTLSHQNRLLVSSVSSDHRPCQSRSSILSNSRWSCSSCDPSLSRSCYTPDVLPLKEEQPSVPLQEMNRKEQEIASNNKIQATPEKKSLTPVPCLSPGRDSQHRNTEMSQNASEYGDTPIDTRGPDHSPDKNRERIIQEWLIHRISANVAGHFGSKLTQMLHEEASKNSNIKKDSSRKHFNATNLRLPKNIITTKSRFTIKKSEEKNQQMQVYQEHQNLSSVATNIKQTGDEIQPIELIENRESNSHIDSNKVSLNNKSMIGQRQVPTTAKNRKSVPRMQVRPRTSGTIVISMKSDVSDSYNYEEVLEIDPRDDIVKSHLNSHDRRIKSVSMKTGCYLSMKGPIRVPSLDGTLKRDKEVYELTIGAANKVKADRCMNFLRETFPNTAFVRKQAQVRALNKF